MTEHSRPSGSEERVREIVRSLDGVEADVDFRARLRQEFVDGTVERKFEPPSAGNVVRLRWAMAAVAAAALLLVALVGNRGPAWEPAGVTGEGRFVVDGHSIPAADGVAGWAGRLVPGVVVSSEGEAQVDLALGRTLTLQVAPGSRLLLPTTPGRWTRRSVTGRIEAGEIRVVTGPDFPGTTLTLEAPSAKVHVTGTTFAVIASADSSCVCVLEGNVAMEDQDGSVTTVHAGTRRTVFAGPVEPRTEEILPMERMKLEMLQDQVSNAERDAP